MRANRGSGHVSVLFQVVVLGCAALIVASFMPWRCGNLTLFPLQVIGRTRSEAESLFGQPVTDSRSGYLVPTGCEIYRGGCDVQLLPLLPHRVHVKEGPLILVHSPDGRVTGWYCAAYSGP